MDKWTLIDKPTQIVSFMILIGIIIAIISIFVNLLTDFISPTINDFLLILILISSVVIIGTFIYSIKEAKNKKLLKIFVLFVIIFVLAYSYKYTLESHDPTDEFKIAITNLTNESIIFRFHGDINFDGKQDSYYTGERLSQFETSILYCSYDKNVNWEKVWIEVINQTYNIRHTFDDDFPYSGGSNCLNFSDGKIYDLSVIIVSNSYGINVTDSPEPDYEIGSSGHHTMDVFILKMNDHNTDPEYLRKIFND